VSTTDQDLEGQPNALAKHGIPAQRIYANTKTGATLDRPDSADAALRPRRRHHHHDQPSTGSDATCVNASISSTTWPAGPGIKTVGDPLQPGDHH